MLPSLQEWAKIQFALKQARIKCLEQMGITETGLRKLEDEARASITQDTQTDYGLVQIIPDKPVQYFVHRLAGNQIKQPFKSKLKLLTTEEV